MQALPSLGGLQRPSSSTPATPRGVGNAPSTPHATAQTPGMSYRSIYAPNFQWNAAPGTPATAPQPSSASALPKETAEDIVSKHEQDILDRTLERVTAQARRDNEKFLEEQIASVWKQDMNVWLSGIVGPRFVGGDTTTRSSKMGFLGTGDALAALPPSSTTDPNAWARTRSLTLREYRQVPLDHAFAIAHWQAVQATLRPTDIVQNLKSLVLQANRTQNQDPVLKGYSTALDLASSLLEANDLSSPIDLACRTVVHFSKQFEDMISIKVQAGINSGAIQDSSTYTQVGARTCELYVNLVLGPNADVWTLLYYALRIGDAKAAYEIWANRPSPDISETHAKAIDTILNHWSRFGVPRLWESGIPPIPPTERSALKELMNQQYAPSSAHFKGVFALLTGYDDLPIETALPGLCDMEDSLFGGLWKALLSDNPLTSLEVFGKNIQSVAPDYKDERSGDWSCVLLLLASQQYASAMWHLAGSGNDVLMQAAHLTLVLSSGSAKIRDLGDPTPAPHVAARVLEKYANTLLVVPKTSSPEPPILMALDYLLRIDDQVHCDKAIASLIVNQNFPADLVGSLSQDGLPSSFLPLAHRLQNHIRYVAILSKAAELASSNLDDTSKVLTALRCHMMARKYDGALSLLKTMLTPPNVPSENREYWLEQSVAFINNCINSRGVVFNELEKNKKLGMVEACSTLVELNRFFFLLERKQLDAAAKVVLNSGLIPRSQTDLDTVVSMYRNNLDDSIRSCYPDVLSGVMDLLSYQHASLKKSIQSGAGTVVLKQMKQLRVQASLVVRLAGLIDTDEVRRSRLSEKQALMI